MAVAGRLAARSTCLSISRGMAATTRSPRGIAVAHSDRIRAMAERTSSWTSRDRPPSSPSIGQPDGCSGAELVLEPGEAIVSRSTAGRSAPRRIRHEEHGEHQQLARPGRASAARVPPVVVSVWLVSLLLVIKAPRRRIAPSPKMRRSRMMAPDDRLPPPHRQNRITASRLPISPWWDRAPHSPSCRGC